MRSRPTRPGGSSASVPARRCTRSSSPRTSRATPACSPIASSSTRPIRSGRSSRSRPAKSCRPGFATRATRTPTGSTPPPSARWRSSSRRRTSSTPLAVRRLHLRWSSGPQDAAPAPAAGDVVLAFARCAAPPRGTAEVLLADDLLGWEERSAIEDRASALIEALRARAPDEALIEASEYELRVEWLNLLLAHAVGGALREAGPFEAVVASAATPAAVAMGVRSALGLAVAEAPGPAIAHRHQAGARDAVARLIVDTRAATTANRGIRVLTFPGLKLGEALAELSRRELAAAG